MRNLIILSIIALMLAGCASSETKTDLTETSNGTTESVAPVGGVGAAMGGAAPVQGSENLGSGSGGSVGQAATSKARSTAAAQSQRVNENEVTTE